MPAQASDLQQEPAIPDDIVWPEGAAKPKPALAENAEKAEAKKAPAKKTAKKPASKPAKKVEKATASRPT